MATLLRADGTEQEVTPRDPRGVLSYTEIKNALQGATISMERLPFGGWMIVDDDYLGSGKPLNLRATILLGRRADQYDVTAGPYDLWPVLGDVLLCGEGEVE